jgi:hypothetical protein
MPLTLLADTGTGKVIRRGDLDRVGRAAGHEAISGIRHYGGRLLRLDGYEQRRRVFKFDQTQVDPQRSALVGVLGEHSLRSVIVRSQSNVWRVGDSCAVWSPPTVRRHRGCNSDRANAYVRL